MDLINILLLVIFIVFAFFLYKGDRGKWEIVYESIHGRASHVYSMYAFLKEREVKCRMKTTMSSYILEVHRDDIKQARNLIREFNNNEK